MSNRPIRERTRSTAVFHPRTTSLRSHRALVVVVLITAVVGIASVTSAAETQKRPKEAAKKILLIGTPPDHPPGTHLYVKECQLLAKCLRQTPGVEAIVSEGWPTDPTAVKDVDAIVLYSNPGAELLFAGDHAETVETLLKNGAGLVALHWSTGVGDKDNAELSRRYLARLGGLFSFAFSGLAFAQTRVERLAPDHPICRGWSDLEVRDEIYLNLKFLPDAKPVLKVRVKSDAPDVPPKEQIVGWAYERPDSRGGRSYGNTLGHFHELFADEEFRKMIVNGILWTAHREVPAGGAPCKLDPDDLKLDADRK